MRHGTACKAATACSFPRLIAVLHLRSIAADTGAQRYIQLWWSSRPSGRLLPYLSLSQFSERANNTRSFVPNSNTRIAYCSWKSRTYVLACSRRMESSLWNYTEPTRDHSQSTKGSQSTVGLYILTCIPYFLKDLLYSVPYAGEFVVHR